VYSDGRYRQPKPGFTTYPDDKPERCGGLKRDGSKCGRWACLDNAETAPDGHRGYPNPRCASHGGVRRYRKRPCHVAACPLYLFRPYHRHGSKGHFGGELVECLGAGNNGGIIMGRPIDPTPRDWKGMPTDHSLW
jgi:hypothetical protein